MNGAQERRSPVPGSAVRFDRRLGLGDCSDRPPEVQADAELVDSREIYQRSYGMMWLCRPCDAYVSCHKNSKHNAPLGILANKELRGWRSKAHISFDSLWKRKIELTRLPKSQCRQAAYLWLSDQLGIPLEKCHIGMFNTPQCKRVVQVCLPYTLVRHHKMFANLTLTP